MVPSSGCVHVWLSPSGRYLMMWRKHSNRSLTSIMSSFWYFISTWEGLGVLEMSEAESLMFWLEEVLKSIKHFCIPLYPSIKHRSISTQRMHANFYSDHKKLLKSTTQHSCNVLNLSKVIPIVFFHSILIKYMYIINIPTYQ